MKKLLALCCFFILTMASAQEISMQKGKFFKNGNQISNWETKQLLITNPEAYQYYKKAKTKEGVGSFLLGIGIGLAVADVVKCAVSDTDYPTGFTYVGAGCIVAAIPIMSGRTKKMQKALEIYNNGIKSATGATGFDLNVLANANGYGLQIRF